MRTHKVKYDDISIKVTGPDDLIRKVDKVFFDYLKDGNMPDNKLPASSNDTLSAEPVFDGHHLIDWEKYAEDIKNGKKVQVGDSAFTKLTNGEIIEFIVTDVTADYVRFETKNFIGEIVQWDDTGDSEGGYPYSYIKKYIDSTIWDLLPEDLQVVISYINRKQKNEDGGICIYPTKLFLPAASEIFIPDYCFGDGGLYNQLDYYKDVKNRIRVDEDGDARIYWTSSLRLADSNFVCTVNADGSPDYWNAHNGLFHVPVCFCISKN